jgi:hypothetical protein
MAVVIEGPVCEWPGGPDGPRRYIVATLPFRQAREVMRAEVYKAATGRGEQRARVASHVRQLRKEMAAGQFTPASVAAGTRLRHRKAVALSQVSGREVARLQISPDDPLPLVDGQQRFGAIEEWAEDKPEALDAPITVLVFLDGDTQRDFLNLQLGKPVDTSHLLSLRVSAGACKDKDRPQYEAAMECARALAATPRSDFYRQIKFDSGNQFGLPVKTLFASGSSDLSSSLLGLARVGLAANIPTNQRTTWMVEAVCDAAAALRQHAPGLLEAGSVLAPPPDHSKSSATMLIGVGVLLAFRLHALGKTRADDEDCIRLAESASRTLAVQAGKKFSAPHKRTLLGEFARDFLADLPGPSHAGIPAALFGLFAPSAYDCPPLPRVRKAKSAPVPETESAADLAEQPHKGVAILTPPEPTASEAVDPPETVDSEEVPPVVSVDPGILNHVGEMVHKIAYRETTDTLPARLATVLTPSERVADHEETHADIDDLDAPAPWEV